MSNKISSSGLASASLWSVLSELAIKVVTPVVYLILTKFVGPDEFGAVAVITTIVSLLVIVSDLGVSKLIIQHNEFIGRLQILFIRHCITFSMLLGLILMIFLNLLIEPIVVNFDIENYRFDLFLLSINIPFMAVNGALLALLKKDLLFKKIFYIRAISVIVPNLIAIILVFNGLGITSIIVSQLLGTILSCLLTFSLSKFKFRIYYNKKFNELIFKKSIWSSAEQLFMWLPMSFDIFIMNHYLSKHEIGLYTTSRTLFTSAIALSLGAITPVAFSFYSKYNNDKQKLIKLFRLSHYVIFFLASILGVLVFNFFVFFESLIFEDQWKGVSQITAIVFLMLSINYFVNPFQDFFNSLGSFKQTSLISITNLLFTIPFLLIGIRYGLIVYLIIRFSFLFFRIIPFYSLYKKIKEGDMFFKFFYTTKYIWLYIVLNVVLKLFNFNLLITIVYTLLISGGLLYLERKMLMDIYSTIKKDR